MSGIEKRKELLRQLCNALYVAYGPDASSDIMSQLTAILGGRRMVVPTPEALRREFRNNEIRSKFDGGNYAALSREYHLSKRQIRYILKGNIGGRN